MLKGSKVFGRRVKTILTSDCLVRSKHSSEGFKLHTFGQTTPKSSFHQSRVQKYPATEPLPLPSNIEDLSSSEKLKFSPQRSREINGSFISSTSSSVFEKTDQKSGFSVNDITECYDCSGAVSLSSAMQTNVPHPFVSKGKLTHLNMPGGQWSQNEKYTSEDLNNVHHINTKGSDVHSGGTLKLGFNQVNKNSYFCFQIRDIKQFGSLWPIVNVFQFRNFCTKKEKENNIDQDLNKKEVTSQVPQLSRKDKLKAAVKDYGAVVIIFHVGISLLSLGCCYMIVASGVDLSTIIKDWGIDEGAATAGTAAQFVIAYAVHKAMAPGRIAITLMAVPFIVRKLRTVGFLKSYQSKLQ